ncbi:hypothetical protein [Coleofasciculus chthonoplastes]|uniref:hypothetical protein n=1 Tax=Coleofasciculus chthonoplastes TaxID=64178 RepID=UPI0032F7EB53
MEVHNSVIEAEVLLKNYGVVLLKGILDTAQLSLVTRSATQCFSYIEQIIHEQGIEQVSDYLPFYYFFNIRVTSVSLFALDDDQVTHAFEKISHQMLSIVVNSLAYQVLAKIMDSSLLFNLSQSWVRKQYALSHYHPLHTPHSWHQDGALGVRFNPLSDSNNYYTIEPLTPLITCWIPLTDCGRDRPGLQFIRRNLDQLLHYDCLNEVKLRQRFAPDEFWSPEMTLGDVLIFLNGTLHKTYVTETMTQDRMSVELRVMSANKTPQWMNRNVFIPLKE